MNLKLIVINLLVIVFLINLKILTWKILKDASSMKSPRANPI